MHALIFDIRRAFALIRVVVKYGSGPLLRWTLNLEHSSLSAGVRLRRAFEELGITYLKLGQFLTMRFDVLPLEICQELNKLFESVPGMSFENARWVVETELKAPLSDLFPVFEREPIAAGSVAQVHVAYNADDEKLAIKIQRIGIDLLFASDMRNLRRLAGVIDMTGILGAFSVTEIAGQFAAWTSREMDFTTEGRTADRLRKNAAKFEIIPRVFWPLTTTRVLTMEFVEGISLAKIGDMVDSGRDDLLAATLPDMDVSIAGRNIAFAVLRHLFVFGFFQGDPHPGNILIRNDNRIGFVDFGIFGELTESQRENVAGFLENLALGNIDQSFAYYCRQHAPTADTDMKAFEREGKMILRLWHETSVNPFATPKERHMGRFATWMIEAIRRHRLRTDPDVVLLWRAIYALDASSERLSKYFDMMSQVQAFFIMFRSGPVGRVAEILGDPQRNIALHQVARDGAVRLGRASSNLVDDRSQWPMRLSESVKERRHLNREVKWLAIAVTAVSLLIAAGLAV